jgi:hypothetical protein
LRFLFTMKLSSILFALPIAASAGVLTTRQTESVAALDFPGPPQIRKDAQRKFFKFGRK